MSIAKIEIRKGNYYDSVTLMQLQASLIKQPGISHAGVMMGTAANKDLLRQSGSILFLKALAPGIATVSKDNKVTADILQAIGDNAMAVLNPVDGSLQGDGGCSTRR